ncbi:MAG: carboxypeptidase-like regulatory domain-containing protein [Candidatus Eremiobacteraeota bacterium]|nr:carboxypeptidase-like regulatory domain-containing protein [Candidatus Eremiobacteraeota bacterium]
MNKLRFIAILGIVAMALAALATHTDAQNTAAIRGRVVDAHNNQPLAEVRASAFSLHGTKAVATSFTKKDGVFRLDGLGPGSYRLELSKNGFRGQTIEGIAVRPAEIMIIAGSIAMQAGNENPPNVAQARNSCGNLVQPGVTADVYVVCGESR